MLRIQLLLLCLVLSTTLWTSSRASSFLEDDHDCPATEGGIVPGTDCPQDGKVCLSGEQECCGLVFSTMICSCRSAVNNKNNNDDKIWQCLPSDDCKDINCDDLLLVKKEEEDAGAGNFTDGDDLQEDDSYECPAEPIDQGTSCDAPYGTICSYEGVLEEEDAAGIHEDYDCFCDGNSWFCYNGHNNGVDGGGLFPHPNCSDIPYENSTTCDMANSFCFWEEQKLEYDIVTRCICNEEEEEEEDNDKNKTTLSWNCESSGWIEYNCSDVPYENSTACTVEGAYCFWVNELSYSHCLCNHSTWQCDEFLWEDEDIEDDLDPDENCSATPYTNGTSCDTAWAYCFWMNKTSYTDCVCYEEEEDLSWFCDELIWAELDNSNETSHLVKVDIDDDGEIVDYDHDADDSSFNCSETPYENGTSCDESGVLCHWENETWYSECLCSEEEDNSGVVSPSTSWDCFEDP